LREFVAEHLSDGRTLRAFDVWERGYGTPEEPNGRTAEQPNDNTEKPVTGSPEQPADWTDGGRV
jgi:hypothetical protein